jgi:hypothetical protein
MTPLDPHGEFGRRVGALLRDSAEALDGRTRSALTRARYTALGQARRRGDVSRLTLRYWAPAGALAMGMIGVMLFMGHGAGRQGGLPAMGAGTTAEDLALLSDADGYEISNDVSSDADLEQDSDFYEWAVASAYAGGSGASGQGLGS